MRSRPDAAGGACAHPIANQAIAAVVARRITLQL
jgi:hypothetical protein